ncbi:MAG: WecB/TagA/CpsF family glycosyltransferase [Clostridiales bacterium]|nr:WecB/TagA/CpsF family glycosyltransferase [Clostridiales bacterium]
MEKEAEKFEIILGVKFESLTFDEALSRLRRFLDTEEHNVCFTPNPEMLMSAWKDAEFRDILNKADLILPDGIGIIMASFFYRRKITRRVGGCDIVQELFKTAEKPLRVYFLGAAPGVCALAKENVEKKYRNISVVGFNDGYFDYEKEKLIIAEIQSLKPDMLLVGIGFPKQEKWIARHKNELPVRLSIGVGGTLDVLAGAVKRAPKIFRSVGAEWLYRLISQPSRYKRMSRLPVFLIMAAWEGVRSRFKKGER